MFLKRKRLIMALFKSSLIILSAILFFHNATAQISTDTTWRLNEVTVRAYFADQPLLKSTGSIGILTSKQLANQPEQSLVSALNTVPGVRMEERSPGSYRLSIRGSLLRSPFGIRNIKIYLDEYALTDAGGNTYLNLLDAGTLNNITVLKGPEASIFGANTGGIVLIDPYNTRDSSSLSASITTGSYHLFHQRSSIKKKWNNYGFNVNQGYQYSGGYRQNSALKRNYASLTQKWQYAKRSQLRSTLLFSDLDYETPGGLTRLQAEKNPRLARPGAIDQHAGIQNKTWMGGVMNESYIGSSSRHVISLFGLNTDLKNPFITNYEERSEHSAGFRTFLEHTLKRNKFHLTGNLGMESQSTGTEVENYGNQSGRKGQLQSNDQLNAFQTFYFAHISAIFGDRLTTEAGVSMNRYKYTYNTLRPVQTQEAKKRFNEQWMPRLAVSYLFSYNLSWRAAISRGYSPPTLAEVRASDNIINTSLQPETGWNYETGFRLSGLNNRIFIDLSVFYFNLQDAIVRRLNENDSEYFINAGGTRQRGLEAQTVQWIVLPHAAQFIKSLQLRNGITVSDFIFNDYAAGKSVFSGNRLTGVPKNIITSSLDFNFPWGFSLFAQHNYTSSIPLNDANSEFSDSYQLVQLKAFWKPGQKNRRTSYQFFAGADNLLNKSYSLGNDLNAAGNRYYNPSAGLNFYGGFSVNWR